MILFAPFVEQHNRESWEEYSNNNQWWIEQDYAYRGWSTTNVTDATDADIYDCTWCTDAINDTRRGFVNEDGFMETILTSRNISGDGLSLPVAQFGPGAVDTSLAKFDLFTHPSFKKEVVASLEYDVPVISKVTNLDFLLESLELNFSKDELRSFTLDQVKEDFQEDSKTVGYLIGVIKWSSFFENLLPEDVDGIVVKIASDCGKEFTYIVNGGKDDWAAEGDWHDPKYALNNHTSKFFWKDHPKGTSRHCHFDLIVYPSDDFYSRYDTNQPFLYAAVVASSFVFAAIVFYLYNIFIVRRNQKRAMDKVVRAEAIVNSVFPKEFGRLLIEESNNKAQEDKLARKPSLLDFMNDSNRDESEDNSNMLTSKPLADLFLNCTVMFADIVGFTAWSSARDPTQVFTLLETIYRQFDLIAKRRSVFKVETVGNCYVAVAGLPTSMKDHHVAMVLFAGDCLKEMAIRTKQLEVALGPDTSTLGIQIGLHSGPVTAGILRGERAQFQLFGDTVNTTTRIESSGEKNRIQISEETADLLKKSGKGHWVTKRSEMISAKGKGELQTYWVNNIKDGATTSAISSATSGMSSSTGYNVESNDAAHLPPTTRSIRKSSIKPKSARSLRNLNEADKKERLVDWNTKLLEDLLKQIALHRHSLSTEADSEAVLRGMEKKFLLGKSNHMVLDEVVDILNLPGFHSNVSSNQEDVDLMNLPPTVQVQLKGYVTGIAHMYQTNGFHNFEHASHVTQSVNKLLGRIIASDRTTSANARELHDHTYGITSDPLTQFTVVFSALLHDVDHSGVPNTTLVDERQDVALHYQNKSVAEQNSIDLAWDFLMEDTFIDLRRAIYNTKDNFLRFRQLMVNTIMATDIMDKELKPQRNERWDKAFAQSSILEESQESAINRKATIVIEHLIQASDVSHTIQHWHVFCQWNTMLFLEMHQAYKDGRSTKDPSEFWYEGEIGFFDFYVIPLAKKLESCGVFGVSSHECLDYATRNRVEWVLKGRALVEELKAMVQDLDYSAADDVGLSVD